MAPERDPPKPPRTRARKPTFRTRLEHALKNLEALGVSIPGSSFLLIWWKRLGLNWAIALLVVFFIPLSEFSLLNFAMKNGVPYMFGDFGVTFDAQEWDLDLIGLRGTAHSVRIARDGRSAPVLTASQIEFNATLGALIGRLIGRPQMFDEIVVRDADLRLEQSLSGDLNWAQFVDTVPVGRRRAVEAGQYQTRALVFDRLRIEYVENVPASSGGGVIQTVQARVFGDDIFGNVRDVIVPQSPGDMPTAFEFKGRSSDGIVQFSGRTAVFPSSGRASAPAPIDVKVYLENVGMGAYGRTVTTTALMPVRGNLRGTVTVVRSGADVRCRSTLIADEVEFAPNPRVVLVRTQYDQLASDLRGYRASGPFDPCESSADANRQSATAVLASFNTQTTLTASPLVRAAAEHDVESFGRAVGASVATDISTRLARAAGGRAAALIGGSTGQAVEQQGGNAITKGAKSVGRGFKSLFGR